MSLFSGRKLRIFSSTFLFSVAFLFWLFVPSVQAFHATSSYSKPTNGTLTSANWNDLFSDFVNTWLPTTMNGPLGIGTTIPPSSGLLVNGPVNALNIYSTSNVGIGKTNPGSALDLIGSINSSGTVNGTGLCIANDCKVSWPAVGAASSGWTQNGLTLYKTDVNGNVGIGTPTPTQKLTVTGVVESTSGGFKFPDGTVQITAGGGGSSQWVSASSTSIYYNGGRVGIGTTNPASSLDVGGTGITLGGVTRTTWPGGTGSGFGTDAGTYAYYMGGNVGFGVTNPTSRLQIYTTAAYDGISIDGNNSPAFKLMNSGVAKGYIALPSSANVFSSDAAANDLVIRTENVSQRILFNVNGGGNSMMALNNGNVGIGTTNPLGRLQVESAGGANTGIRLNLSSGSSYAPIDFYTPTGLSGQFLATGATFTNGGFKGDELILASELPAGGLHLGAIGASGYIKFTAGGLAEVNERMRINSAGNIGIAKTNPGTTLDIVGSMSASGTVNGTGLCIAGDCKVSWPTIVAAGGGNLWSGTTTGAIWSANSGNVGIGTTNPLQKLHLTSAGDLWELMLGGTATSTSMVAFGANGDDDWGVGRDANNNFAVNDLDGLGTRFLINKTSGNVGIGTTNPTAPLNVAGSVLLAKNQNTATALNIDNDDLGASVRSLLSLTNVSSNFEIGLGGSGRADGWADNAWIWNSANAPMRFGTNGQERMRIEGGGNTGIGTVNPVSKLSISDATTPTLSIYNSVDNNVEGGRIRFLETPSTTFLGGFIHYDGSANVLNIGTHTIGDQLASNDVNTISLSRGTGNVGINKGAPGTTLDIVGSLSASGTVNGTGLCIAGDCKVSWAAVGAASSGWTQNGNEVYKTNTNGNVGVGTTAPAMKLDVIGTDQRMRIGDGTNNLVIGQWDATNNRIESANRPLFITSYSGNINFGPSGGTVFSITQGSNVGVGTTTPTARLHVQGSADTIARFENSGANSNPGIEFKNDANTWTLMNAGARADNFEIYDVGSGAIRLAIKQDGNVGIGTTSPETLLHIAGNSGAYASTGVSGSVLYAQTTGASTYPMNAYFNAAGTTDNTVRHRFANNGVNKWQVNYSNDINWYYDTPGTGSWSPGVTFQQGGNVGINKSTPAATLDIVGSLSASGTVNGTGLCIAGDCKVSWAAVGAASSGWTQNGNEVYKTNTAGNVGIGVTAPSSKLVVSIDDSNYKVPIQVINTGTGAAPYNGFDFYTSGTNVHQYLPLLSGTTIRNIPNTPIYMYTNNTSSQGITIAAGGNIGVGITNPDVKLRISGAAAGAELVGLKITNTDAAAGSKSTILLGESSGNVNRLQLTSDNNSGQAYVGNPTNYSLNFFTNGIANPRMTIKGDGNVGVGTTDPTYKFDVTGAGRFTSVLTVGDSAPTILQSSRGATDGSQISLASNYSPTVGAMYSSAAAFLSSNARQTTGGVDAWGKGATTYSSNLISLGISTANNGTAFQVKHSPANTASGAYGTFFPNTLFAILEGGNVGVAKANPATTLDIVGSLSASGTVNGTGLCIAGDCKVSWAAVGAASSGWTQNGTTVYKTDTNGNIGIGITAPTAKLQVGTQAYGTAPDGQQFQVGLDNYSGAGPVAGVSGYPIIANKDLYASSILDVIGGWEQASGNHPLLRVSAYNTINSTPSLVVLNGGNVGVGTTAPNSQFEVRSSASSTINIIQRLSSAGNNGAIMFGERRDNGGTLANPLWVIDSFSGEPIAINAGASGNFNGANATFFASSGNVGIGTTNPSNLLTLSKDAGITSNPGVAKADVIAFKVYYTGYDVDSTKATIGSGFDGVTGWNTANGLLTFSTANAGTLFERMRIMASGNVGIAKTNPGTTLDVTGGINASGTVNGTGLCIGGDCKVSWPAVGAASSGWTQNGNEVYKTNTAGNVGIGTTNPGFLLDVGNYAGTTAVSNTLRVTGYKVNADGAFANLRLSNAADSGGSYFGIVARRETGNYGVSADFTVNEQTTGATPLTALTLKYNGNVGIGITNPNSRLHSYNFTADGTTGRTNIIDVLTLETANTAAAPYRGFGQGVEFRGRTYSNATVRTLGRIATVLTDDSVTNTGTAIVFQNVADSVTATAPVERMRISYDGNVGVSKTNPSTTLDVVGSINASGTVNGTGLCIGGDCKVSWPAVGSASSGWNRTAPYIYPATLTDNVGIGVTNPGAKLQVNAGALTLGNEFSYAGWFGNNSTSKGVVIGYDSTNNVGQIGSINSGVAWTNLAINANGGNVGIGTTSPMYKFDVLGPAGDVARFTNGTESLRAYLGSSYKIFQTNANDQFGYVGNQFYVTANGGTEAVRVNLSGNVGIGTASPETKLDVYGGTDTSATIQARYNRTSVGNIRTIFKAFHPTSGNSSAIIGADSGSTDIQFVTGGNTPTQSKMTILSGGNVGIAKTNPGTTLDVVGSINASGTVNGTGLCIGGDCKVSWPAVGAASSGWTQNGSVVYKTDTAGNVGIGTTNPTAAKLTISGDLSATGATLSGALVMNGGGTKQNITGVNKLTVDVIDPLYYINGVNYSSYAASMVGGVKEEYVGKIKLDKKNRTVQEFEATLDFASAAEGSELWLWRKVVNFNKDNVEVLITPYGRFARTYYFLDGEKIIFRSDLPVEISYRLIGKRFDWRKWPTRALDQTERGMDVE